MAQHVCIYRNSSLLLKRPPESLTSQFVRWRKPIWLPKAKSKIYRVPVRPEPNEEENAVMLKWTHDYNCSLKSMRSYVIDFSSRQESLRMKTFSKMKRTEAVKEWPSIQKKNEAWNDEVEKIRLADMAEISMKLSQKSAAIMERDIREKDEQRDEAEQRLARELVAAKGFIKQKDIEKKIEELLNTRSDYNFALDLGGSKIKKDEYGT